MIPDMQEKEDVKGNTIRSLEGSTTFQKISKDNRKSLIARVKPEDLIVFNQRLKLFGFNSINELVREFIAGRFPQITEDKQIGSLAQNIHSNGQRTVLDNENNTFGSFYQSLDFEDMINYYHNIRSLHPKTSRDLVEYFKRFRGQFFSKEAEQLRILSPRIRSKIIDSFRKFGQYYLYKYNDDSCIDLVSKIIRRYNLNAGNNDHGRLYIVDDNYLEEKIRMVLQLQGEIGLIVRFAMYSGLREDELTYIHKKEVCPNLSGCSCERLHVIEKSNGLSIILVQWYRGHKKCYFSIVPTSLWKAFRGLHFFDYNPHIKSAHSYLKAKDKDLHFMWLRKAHYNVMSRTMKPFEANILAGRAKTVDAKHYAMYELDAMSKSYAEAWRKIGIDNL
jgi:intergrase/recombinase